MLVGTDDHDALYSSGGTATLIGGLGDDTYYLWEWTTTEIVLEAVGGGVDTVVSYGPRYVLADQVENLVVPEDNTWGVGNALDNLITGGDGRQFLDAGAGDDVLTGGAGADLFVIGKGGGSDVITDFQVSLDAVRIGGSYGHLGTFQAVQAAMAQVGADTVLDLGGGEHLVFRGQLVSAFSATNFALPLDYAALRLTFADEFASFSASSTGWDASGEAVWRTTHYWGQRTLPNKEVEYYSDATVGVDPFTLQDGMLRITAAPAAPGTALPDGLTYTSGMIQSQTMFAQLYGHFEMRAQMPAGAGFWPAFWLLPDDGTWPPEIDVVEVLGGDPTKVYTTVHTASSGAHSFAGASAVVADTSAGFHTYGMSWRPDMIRWYVDGTEVFAAPTPVDLTRPMRLVTNLAVGGEGSWPGPTDGASSATMSIDYIRAYQFADLMPSLPPLVLPEPEWMMVLVGNAGANTLVAKVGRDRIEGGRGSDTLVGGSETDVFVFSRGDGQDVISDFQSGVDKVVLQGAGGFKISTKTTTWMGRTGIEVSYGDKDKILLAGVTKLATGDVTAAPASLSGSSNADALDRSGDTVPMKLSGWRGNDTLRGGAAGDWLEGGRDDDVLVGGGGADSFVLTAGDGRDRVDDFASGVDRIVLMGIEPATVTARWASAGNLEGIEIAYGGAEDAIFLSGREGLSAGDLVFA